MHQPSHSVGWHLLDPQMHKSVQLFNWALYAGTTSMPPVIPSQAPACGREGCKSNIPDGSAEDKKSQRDQKIKIHANFILQ